MREPYGEGLASHTGSESCAWNSRKAAREALTGAQTAPWLPKPSKQRKGGRPWIENRRVLEGILWILRSGARWQDLPEQFPHPSTCWRRLRDWEERGIC